jgi:hypothetical protein
MHPATKKNIPPTDNQHRMPDKAAVWDDAGIDGVESDSTAVGVAGGPLRDQGVEVGV